MSVLDDVVEHFLQFFDAFVVHTKPLVSRFLNSSVEVNMGLTEEEFREWCYRNGGETYGRSDRSGIVFHFPDTEIPDRVGYIPTNGAFQVITEGLRPPPHRYG